MDVSHLINALNPAQRAAVTADKPHTLVLAGAGSGKTRVLVHRIAWLLLTGQSHPHQILAVTFTNKAAKEMQARLVTLLAQPTQGLWVGTFHGIAHRLLRIHWREANLPQNFQILDNDDQLRALKRVIQSLQLDEKKWTPKQVQSFVNNCKDKGSRAKDLQPDARDMWLRQMQSIYHTYEEYCQRTGVIDFAEILLKAYELIRDNQELRTHYQQRFTDILVDEFQDTNSIQYQWLCLLAGKQGRLFVVGDDDQSIYSWRGAQIENLQNFPRDFPDNQVVKLEQNYRSTGNILAVANALIAHNKTRLGKELWTEGADGEPVFVYKAYDEHNEARFVAEKIQAWDGNLQEVAILYRTSAQSRVFEDALMTRQIPYRIYGGLRFYERAEVKDVLAYLRLIIHHHDDSAFERIINTPARGIGEKTVESIRAAARAKGLSLWQASEYLLNSQGFTKRSGTAVFAFQKIILEFAEQFQNLALHAQIDAIIKNSGLCEVYLKEGKEESQRRFENLDELSIAAQEFEASSKDGNDPVTTFLAHAALEAGEGQSKSVENCVQLMTLHLAKGLEFNQVFLCGLEEGLFPHENSLKEGSLEEERRLCYVGITRARQSLYLCHSESRYRYGQRDFSNMSRFIQEIPAELLEEIRLRSSYHNAFGSSAIPACTVYNVGDEVKHQVFGQGVVLEYEGQGDYMRVHVLFREGKRWLIAGLAGLERV